MFESFKRWWHSADLPNDGARGPLPEDEKGDWVVIPYRLAEACRLSMYTVASHPQLPDHVKVWMEQWLDDYNTNLAHWFEKVYGPDVFVTLNRITEHVKTASEKFHQKEAEQVQRVAFQRWEEEITNGGTPSDPPSAG